MRRLFVHFCSSSLLLQLLMVSYACHYVCTMKQHPKEEAEMELDDIAPDEGGESLTQELQEEILQEELGWH